MQTLLSDKSGLEIGGPSSIFQKEGLLPIYPIFNNLDNCNFADLTIWEGRITQGVGFQYDKNRPLGGQFKDYELKTNEADLSHLPEILERHDFKKDPGLTSVEALKKQAEHNYENRCLHYHVFDTSHVIEIVHYLNLQIIDVEPLLVCHILIIARKVQAENFPNNDKYLVNDAKYRHTSPFMSGRH